MFRRGAGTLLPCPFAHPGPSLPGFESRRWRLRLVVGVLAVIFAVSTLQLLSTPWMPPNPAQCRAMIPSIGKHSQDDDATLRGVRPRVLISTGSYNNIVDGVSNSLNKLVAYLLAHDYDVLVLAPTLPRGGSAREHVGDLLPTPSYGLPFRPEYRAAFMDACTELRIAEFAPDLVHIATPDKLGFDVQRWAAKRSLPVVCSYHTRFPAYIEYYMSLLHEPVEQALWAWLKFFYGNCLQTYPPSTSTLEELKRNGFGGDIRLWPRGIDLKAFNPRYRSTALRAEWGASSRTSVILLVCRMVAEKNLALFVRVIAALRNTALDFKVVIAGDGPLLGWMRKRLPEAVFMGTMVKEDLARVYASADVFFFPSKTETLGSVTLEAMASGTAVLAGNTTGSSDIVTHMRTGLLVDPDDFEGWVRAMIGLINDPPLRRRLADGALAALAASTDTTWDRSFHMLTGYYDEVLRGQHAQQHQQADPSEN